jgi:hypothetical protein
MKTMEVVQHLGTSYLTLTNLVRYGRIPKPGKDSSGDLVWKNADVEGARQALANRRRCASAPTVPAPAAPAS